MNGSERFMTSRSWLPVAERRWRCAGGRLSTRTLAPGMHGHLACDHDALAGSESLGDHDVVALPLP